MLKKSILFFTFVLLSTLMAYASIVPTSVSDIPSSTIGVYQTDKKVTVYSEPDSKSAVVYETEISYSKMIGRDADNMFAILVPEKDLGYLYVTDTSDDESWVQVIYDKEGGRKGWVYKNDDFQFMPWVNFYNLYGRKYGLSMLKSDVLQIKGVFSNPDDNAHVLGKISRPKLIHMTSIEGIWMLVSILDMSGNTITGYIRWRDSSGAFFLFPVVK